MALSMLKAKQPKQLAQPARLPDQNGDISLNIVQLANNIGKKYGITGQQIYDRYLQIRKMTAFDAEALNDLVENVLVNCKEEAFINAFVKPIKGERADNNGHNQRSRI